MGNRSRTTVMLAVTALLLSGVAGATGAQEQARPQWSWPEHAENLQSLPEDFPPERLRAVMTGFTRSLGVRCEYCHMGEAGQPLSTFDFASDDKREKRTARKMLALLGAVNGVLDEIEPREGSPVNMWCHTCHHGKPLPTTLAEEMQMASDAGRGVDAAVARFGELRERYFGTSAFDFSEDGVSGMASQMHGAGETEAAIAFFRLNTEHYPESAMAWGRLGIAHAEAGNGELAVQYLQKAHQLDPDNEQIRAKLDELRGPRE